MYVCLCRCIDFCMYVCMHVCMYVCMYVFMCRCLHQCMFACIRLFHPGVHWIKSVCIYRAGPTSSRNPRQKRSQLVRVITNHPVDAFVHCTFWINISDDQTSSCITPVTAKQIESNVIRWKTKWPLAVMEGNGEKLQNSSGGRSGDRMAENPFILAAVTPVPILVVDRLLNHKPLKPQTRETHMSHIFRF